jgi:ribonuclease HII
MAKLKLDQISLLEFEGPIEPALVAAGWGPICGVDEAGRGPLAGPVVAAAVIYHACDVIGKCGDSKQLTARVRDDLFEGITTTMIFGVGQCTPEEIDELNIRGASLEAMKRAVESLSKRPRLLLVDGRDCVPMQIKSLPIIRGDARVACIGAASIIAKVTRDRIMIEYDALYPCYGFSQHKGYPTLEHRSAVKQLGPTPIHRRSFRGVREYI